MALANRYQRDSHFIAFIGGLYFISKYKNSFGGTSAADRSQSGGLDTLGLVCNMRTF